MLTEWQPIETAPKDGTRILLAERGSVFEGGWAKPYDEENDAGWFPSSAVEDWQMREYGPSHPGHWMPLPPAPASA